MCAFSQASSCCGSPGASHHDVAVTTSLPEGAGIPLDGLVPSLVPWIRPAHARPRWLSASGLLASIRDVAASLVRGGESGREGARRVERADQGMGRERAQREGSGPCRRIGGSTRLV